MNLSTEQLAELLAGIARAQQAIIDAIDSENGGWKNTHLLPKVNTAANMRLAVPRLMDVPSRVLMRSQGRVPMDVPTITRMLEEALSGVAAAPAAAPAAQPSDPLPLGRRRPRLRCRSRRRWRCRLLRQRRWRPTRNPRRLRVGMI